MRLPFSAGLRCAAAVALLLASARDGSAQTLHATELLAIGTLDGELALTRVGGVLLSASGEIYIAQPQDPAVLVIDARGRLVRRIGRRGDGPGEYRTIGRMGWHDGLLWVGDRHRLTLLTPDGEYARSIAPQLTDAPPMVTVGSVTTLLADGSLLATPLLTGPVQDSDRTTPLLRFDRDGSYLGSTMDLATGPILTRIIRGARFTQVRQPLIPGSLYQSSPSGDYVAGIGPSAGGGGEDAVLIVTWAGSSDRREVVLPPGGGSLTRATVERGRAELEQTLLSASFPPGEARRIARDSLRVPQSGVTHLVAGDDGIVWLRMVAEEPDGARWYAYDVATERSASLTLPVNVEIRQSNNGRIVAVRRDEYDVEQVVLYRVDGW